MSPKHKKLIIIGSVLLLIVLLNPTLMDFKDYTGSDYGTKTSNYLLFSVFHVRQSTYVGAAKNFFKTHEELEIESKTDTAYTY